MTTTSGLEVITAVILILVDSVLHYVDYVQAASEWSLYLQPAPRKGLLEKYHNLIVSNIKKNGL